MTTFLKTLGHIVKLPQTPYAQYQLYKFKKSRQAFDLDQSLDFAFTFLNGPISFMQVREEIRQFITIVSKRQPKFILEVGTAGGGTLFLLAQAAARDSSLISIDLSGGPFGGGYPITRTPLYKSFAGPNQKISLLRSDSHKLETLNQVKNILGGNELDLLFIDGDHSYEGVKKDFDTYSPLVKKNGLIAFHDIVPGIPEYVGGVRKFWLKTKTNVNHLEIVKDWNQGGYGIGIIGEIPN